ncbi:hypothetical protein TNCV_3233891 [Trichonephila clavipes]|nr:hypothetical protein TNCV_3233891 [Trichonephila clavipes]
MSRLIRPPVGVVWKLGEGGATQESFSSLDHGSKLRESVIFFLRATLSPSGRRVARPMGRVPLPPQIAFLPCTSQSKDKSKARLPIGRENLGHWSIESL